VPRRDVVIRIGADAPVSKSTMHTLLTSAVSTAAEPDAGLRLVIDVDATTTLTIQARTVLLREFPAGRPVLRVVLRSRDGTPAGLLRAARSAGLPTVTR
jgi:hypothetical protein